MAEGLTDVLTRVQTSKGLVVYCYMSIKNFKALFQYPSYMHTSEGDQHSQERYISSYD